MSGSTVAVIVGIVVVIAVLAVVLILNNRSGDKSAGSTDSRSEQSDDTRAADTEPADTQLSPGPVATQPATESSSGIQPGTPDPDRDYPDQVRENFTRECVNSGGVASTCDCSLEAIEALLTLDEFIELEQQYLDTNVIDPILAQAFASCA